MDILLDFPPFQAYSVIMLMVTLTPASSIYLHFTSHECDLDHAKQIRNIPSQRSLNR